MSQNESTGRQTVDFILGANLLPFIQELNLARYINDIGEIIISSWYAFSLCTMQSDSDCFSKLLIPCLKSLYQIQFEKPIFDDWILDSLLDQLVIGIYLLDQANRSRASKSFFIHLKAILPITCHDIQNEILLLLVNSDSHCQVEVELVNLLYYFSKQDHVETYNFLLLQSFIESAIVNASPQITALLLKTSSNTLSRIPPRKSSFIEIIQNILNHRNWNVIDSIYEFIHDLFKSSNGAEYACINNFPLLLFQDVSDAEYFIRSSSILFLAKISCKKQGFKYLNENSMNSKSLIINFIEQLVEKASSDSEAFVRRSCIESFTLLSQDQEFTDILLNLSDRLIILSRQLSNDNDWEVRRNFVYLLTSLFTNMTNRSKGFVDSSIDSDLFFVINGHSIVLEMVNDISRCVRRQVYLLLLCIKEHSRKRMFPHSIKLANLLDGIGIVDQELLDLKSREEGLYDEVLEFEVDGSLVREDDLENDGNNILCCYD